MHILHAGVLHNRLVTDFDLRYWLTHHNLRPNKRDWVVLAYQLESHSQVRKTPHRRYACHFISADWATLLDTVTVPDAQQWSQLCACGVFSTTFHYRPPKHRATRFVHITTNEALQGNGVFTLEQGDYESLLECMQTMQHRADFLANLTIDVSVGFGAPDRTFRSFFGDRGPDVLPDDVAAAIVAARQTQQLIFSRFLFRYIARTHCRLLAEMLCGVPFHYKFAAAGRYASLAFRFSSACVIQFNRECLFYSSADWLLFFRLLSHAHWVIPVQRTAGPTQYAERILEPSAVSAVAMAERNVIAWRFPRYAQAYQEPHAAFMPQNPSSTWHDALVAAGLERPAAHTKWQAWRARRTIPLSPAWNQFLEYITTLHPLQLPALVLQHILTYAEPWLELLTEEEMLRIITGVNATRAKIRSNILK